MNPKSLEALVLDRSFGELSPEAEELLDAYVAVNPDARKEVSRIASSLKITGAAIQERPDLFSQRRLSDDARPASDEPKNSLAFPSLRSQGLRAAAAVALLIAVGAASYFAGQRGTQTRGAVLASDVTARTEPEVLVSSSPAQVSPWAQYRLTASGLQTIIAEVPVNR